MKRISYLFALSCALVAATALAQVAVPVGNWNNNGWGNNQAVTAGQSYMMGMSDMVQAAGQANLANSQAAINVQQARSQWLDNELKGTNTYFQMRQANTQYRRAERGPGLSTEDAWRIAQSMAPQRLNHNQLDPTTGRIYWPMLLTNPKYDEYRKQLDALFVERERSHGSIGFDTFTQINNVTTAFLATLQANIKDYSSGDYMQLRRFVEGLQTEARFPSSA